jgi:two-component system OmpR family sensor kinase
VSLRARLLLALIVVALVALVITDAVTYSSLRSFLYNQSDQSLAADHSNIELVLGGVNQIPTSQSLLATAPGTFAEVRRSDGTVIAGPVAAYEQGNKYTPRLPERISGLKTSEAGGEASVSLTTPSNESGGPAFRVRVWQLSGGDQLILGAPLGRVAATLHHLLLLEIAVTAGGLLVAFLLGWWVMGLGLRPLTAIERTADAIAAGELEQRVPGEGGRTEVGRLAKALNVMLSRIQNAFAQRDATEEELRNSEARLRRFVADASHELRTPVAAVSAYAELFERGAGKSSEDMQRVMRGIRGETARMGQLVEDLLLLARLDEGRPLEQEPVELVALASEALQTAQGVGLAWPLQLEADHPIEVTGDEARLRQVLDNLLSNIRAHTPPGTPGIVRLKEVDDAVIIEVEDEGPGLSAHEAGRVFERFYRVDQSRNRTTGGAGLGLSIVAAIVTAHGGAVTAEAGAKGGALFRVRLPRTRLDPVSR